MHEPPDQAVIESAPIAEPLAARRESDARRKHELDGGQIGNGAIRPRFANPPDARYQIPLQIGDLVHDDIARSAIDAGQAELFTCGEQMGNEALSIKLGADAHIREHPHRAAIGFQLKDALSDPLARSTARGGRKRIALRQ